MELIKNNTPTDTEGDKPSAPQVNDIAPPATATAAEQPAPANDANVAAEPQRDKPKPSKDAPGKEAERPKPVKPPKAPRRPGSGGAIFAAVVIILALGAMFTYAYLRSNNISLF